MNETLSELRRKPHWSFSSLNGFLNICSLQWAFKYIYNIEPESTPVSLLFGTAFHKTASWIAKVRQESVYETSEEAQEVFSEAWKIECRSAPKTSITADEFNQLNSTGRKMIDTFSRKWTEDNIVAIGKAFSVSIEGISKPLIGEVDLIVKSDAGINVIIDWKTAERKWPEGKADKDLQATCFCYAYKKIYDEECLFRYDVVTKAKEPSYTQHRTFRSRDEFSRLENLIRMAERAVSAEIFIPNEQSFYCSGCAYASACKSWHKSKTISLPVAVQENYTMNNGLILHCGAKRVSRSDLMSIPTPPPTRTHKPVPHIHIAELIAREAENRGYAITSEEYGLSKEGEKMFGVLRFHPEGHPEYSKALGFRNSHDKSLAVGLTAGLSVTVCDNLAFGGETVIHRKHTNAIEIETLIPQAFDDMARQFVKLELNVEMLKVRKITLDEAKLMIVQAAEIKAIPSCDIISVLNEFREPRHEDFREHNRWSLYNSFTETAKKYSAPRADFCYRKLGSLFALS